jgi:hypothetical protein
MAEKKKWPKWRDFWPDVNDEKGLKFAINCGAVVGLWFAISYVVSATFVFYTGKALFTGEVAPAEQVITLIVDAILVTVALILGWRIWKRAGHISAIVILIWSVAEVATKAYYAPGKGIIASLIILVLAINGVRGTLAKRNQMKTAALSG